MRSNKLKMTKRFKSKRGGSSKPPPCKGRKKTVGQHKCEDSSGCKWIPKKGKVNGHCATRTQSSNSKKSVKAKKNSVNGKPAMPEGPYYDPSHYKPLTASERKAYHQKERNDWEKKHPIHTNSKKSVKAKKNSVNGKPPMPEGPYYDPSHYKPLTTSERKDYQNELRLQWNANHPLPKEGVKLTDDEKNTITEMDFYKTSKEQTKIDKFLGNFEYKPQEDPEYEEWMDDYDEMSDVFIQAAYEVMAKFVK